MLLCRRRVFRGLLVVWLAVASASEEEKTCSEGGLVVEVLENGASSGTGEVVALDAAHCECRAAFEAQISLKACGDVVSCEARDAAGRVVTSCEQLKHLEEGVQPVASRYPLVYGAPRSKRFVFASEDVGFARWVPQAGVTLRTLALSPRLFAVENFLTPEIADAVVADALAIDDEEHKLMRSSTGPSGYNPSNVRTSENAWLKYSPAAMDLKRKAFSLLGFSGYDEDLSDGLQVLRYNESKAYIAHTDYLSQPAGVSKAAMDPAQGGANRLATLFLYLSDVDAGGQTVFPYATRPDNVKDHAVLGEYLEASNLEEVDVDLRRAVAAENSWEDRMIADCFDKLAVKPKKARAILYYSQHPSGHLDVNSQHGGCPVLNGTKWAANLWVWNKKMPFGSSRFGGDQQGAAAKAAKTDPNAVPITIEYHGARDDVALFWDGKTKIGDEFRPHGAMNINSYVGHTFVAKNQHGRIFNSFTVEHGKATYVIDG